MPLLPYDYLHLVNYPEVVIISDILCIQLLWTQFLLYNNDSNFFQNPQNKLHPRQESADSGVGGMGSNFNLDANGMYGQFITSPIRNQLK